MGIGLTLIKVVGGIEVEGRGGIRRPFTQILNIDNCTATDTALITYSRCMIV